MRSCVLLLLLGCLADAATQTKDLVAQVSSTPNIQSALKTLQNTARQLTLGLSAAEAKLKSSQNQLSALRTQLANVPRVGFTVSLAPSNTIGLTSVGPYYDNTILVYSNVFSNVGNGYNSATGIFTVPVSGLYQFSFYSYGGNGNSLGVSLYKNGLEQISVQLDSSSVNSIVGNGIVLQLAANETVNTRLWANAVVYDGPNHQTTFSGVLVVPM